MVVHFTYILRLVIKLLKGLEFYKVYIAALLFVLGKFT